MSETQFIYWAEVPFRVYAEAEKAQIQTRNEPGYPAQMTINKIEVAGDELEGLPQPFKDDVTMENLLEHVLETEYDMIETLAWEHRED